MALFAHPAPFVRRFSFPEGDQRVDGGCAVMVTAGTELGYPIANQDDAEDFAWDAARTAAFLAGEPLTLGWISQSPQIGNERAYVCCWVTVDND